MMKIGNRNSRAFSLIELMVVMAVLIILMAMAVPAFRSVAVGSAVTRAGQAIADQLALASQEATGKNRDIQVRFLWFTNAPAGYKALQLWAPSSTNVTTYEPVGKLIVLPQDTLVSSNSTLSPLIDNASIPPSSEADFGGRGNLRYFGFRFRAGGGTDLPFGSANNYLTVVKNEHAATTEPPDNYFVVQVDPDNGSTQNYRP